jgi:hypothetical protein
MNYILTKSDNPIKSYDIKCGTKSAKKFKKSPTRPTLHGDFSEQARVSNLVSTPKVSLGIDLSNPYNVFRIWGGRPDGVLNSAGITHWFLQVILQVGLFGGSQTECWIDFSISQCDEIPMIFLPKIFKVWSIEHQTKFLLGNILNDSPQTNSNL